jgi:hypothetical protein
MSSTSENTYTTKRPPIFKIKKKLKDNMKGEWLKSEKLSLTSAFILHKVFLIPISKLAFLIPSRTLTQIVNKIQKERKALTHVAKQFLSEYEFDPQNTLEDNFCLVKDELCTFIKMRSEKFGEKDLISDVKTSFSLLPREIEERYFKERDSTIQEVFLDVQSLSIEISNEDYELLTDICRHRVPIFNYKTISEFLIRKCEKRVI